MTAWIGPVVLVVFFAAYLFVFAEERLALRKSKPFMAAAGVVWVLVSLAFHAEGRGDEVATILRTILLEYAELFLFLLAAMSFVNTLVERNVFEALRARLVAAKISFRAMFWTTGTCAFFLSPIADNLTTSLVMGAVALSAFADDKKLIPGALVNIVVAANAGGAFSPFGDITTLMIWQKGLVEFSAFFYLFFPSLINWILPAFIISLTFPKAHTKAVGAAVPVHKGGYVVALMFLTTIALTVFLDHALNLPPFVGMMMGLSALNLYSYFLNNAERRLLSQRSVSHAAARAKDEIWSLRKPFDIFGVLEKTEWDTLLFFYGIMLCIGGVSALGYLETFSAYLYGELGPTTANIINGFLSAIVGNIPLTFIIITMNPAMDLGQWLLVTLSAGVGGSLLATGSAAGVALMGIGKDKYTFMSHLRWTWAIALGFVASIGAHMIINSASFGP